MEFLRGCRPAAAFGRRSGVFQEVLDRCARSVNVGEADRYPPTSATPASTAKAPAVRRAPRRSCKTNLASTVSSTKLADDAGTAKLSGSVCTKAMNEKNDTALQATPRITKRPCAIPCNIRPTQ